jgi:drug/metabolite transporter (DMT)-like permease
MASLYILIAIFLWSSLGVLVRLSGVEIHVLMFYSMIVSLIAQSFIVFRRDFRKEMSPVSKLRYPALLGCVSLINTFTYFYAFANTTIANAVLTHYTAPVFVAFLAPLLLREPVTRKIVMVIVIASTGLWIMLDGVSFYGAHTTGIIAGLLSGLAYAVIVIILRIQTQRFSPIVLVFLSNAFLALLLAPFIREFPAKAIWSFLVMGIVHSTIAPVLYFKGLKSVEANKAAALGYLEPVSAIILSAFFFNELPGIYTAAGGMLILFSGYLTLRGGKNAQIPRI